MALRIEEREAGPGRSVIRIDGRITLGEAASAIETLVKRLMREGRHHLVFDLSGVTHIDSTGIGQFIACLNQVAPPVAACGWQAPPARFATPSASPAWTPSSNSMTTWRRH